MRSKRSPYAEAGIDYAYSILATNFTQKEILLKSNESEPQTVAFSAGSDGVFSLMMGQLGGAASSLATKVAMEEGSFSLTLTSISNKYVIINSAGQCGDCQFGWPRFW